MREVSGFDGQKEEKHGWVGKAARVCDHVRDGLKAQSGPAQPQALVNLPRKYPHLGAV